ncbi:histidine phosphatase family protein [Halobacillus litoralis]|uniref:histidine phosphatase family protein n=1 Tax=Halobacillus litoralis TaxID=45668 RepID=UPI001CD56D25|nr:histidine phosphatase family protein [Halobacillus litoralis]MCA1024062.1 histidine phosphatase family protein [Halobacillus litoralis]
MKIGLIRHGSTSWNKEKRAQGGSDIPLDDEGTEQAARLSTRLKKETWDALYSSPLKRAVQTAEVAAKELNIGFQLDDRLQEVGGGQIEGTTETERIEKWGENWRDLELGREPLEDVLKRCRSFIEDLMEKHPGQHVLVISHGGIISQIIQMLDSAHVKEETMKNTSVSEVVFRDNEWSCEPFNCTRHLDV